MRTRKKSIGAVLSAFAVVVTMARPVFAETSDGTAMFGENQQRTHQNGIYDPLPWMDIGSVQTLQYAGNSSPVGGGNGTAVGQGSSLYFPVSSQGDDPKQAGYLTSFDLSNWSNGNPIENWANHIQGVSNSSPVVHDGKVFLAAGDALYGYNSTNGDIYAPMNLQNLHAMNPITQNQVKSHPLYATGTEMGTSTDLVWVSSQNGYLFAVDPDTLSRVYAVDIGSRMDGSATLITDTSGKPYIAVCTAYDPNNTGGIGTLYIIDPTTGKVVTYMANPFGQIPVVTAPVATGQGYLMYNDYNGNVILLRLNADKTITSLNSWPTVGGAGKTTNQEAGYTKGSTNYYVLPFSSESKIALIDTNNFGSSPVLVPINGNAISSPTVSSGDSNYDGSIYVGDSNGFIDQIDNAHGVTQESAPYIGGISGQVNGTQNLASVMEANMPFALNASETVPTLAFVGGDGLHIWQNVGANYDVAYGGTSETYTSGQKASFNKPLTLSFTSSRTFRVLSGSSDKVNITYTVDGGPAQDLTTVPAFDNSGNIETKITLDAQTLNQAAQTWSDGNTHKVTFTAQAASGDQFRFTFNSKESGNDQTQASVTVPFQTQGSTSSGSSGGVGTNGYVGNLKLKFAPIKTAILMSSSPTIPLEVTNEGNQAVDTSINFSFHASDSWPYRNGYVGGPTPETNFGMDEYVSFPVHVPANKTITINVPNQVGNPFYDSCYAQWQQYNQANQSYQFAFSAYQSARASWSANTDPNKGAPPVAPTPPTQPNVPNVHPAKTNPSGSHLWNLDVGQRWEPGAYNGPSYNGSPSIWFVPDSNYNVILNATIDPDHSIKEQSYSDNADSLVISPGAPLPPAGHSPVHLG